MSCEPSVMTRDALIHLRVPAATKGRWVRASRAAGMRLTDWITEAVEARMQQQITKIAIPDDLDFSDLNLQRDPDGGVSFDWSVIERICDASGVPVALFRDSPEGNVSALLVQWYQSHRSDGGDPDPVAEDLIAETTAEESAGQGFSLPGGRG